MSIAIMLIPINTNVGISSIRLGIVHALKSKGINANFFNPITNLIDDNLFISNGNIEKKTFNLNRNLDLFTISDSINLTYIKDLYLNNKKDFLIEKIISNYYKFTNKNAEVIIIEGLILNKRDNFTQSLNYEIAKSLNANIVLVMSHNGESIKEIEEYIRLTYINYSYNILDNNISGVIINKLNPPYDISDSNLPKLSQILLKNYKSNTNKYKICTNDIPNNIVFPIHGVIPWNIDLISTRAIDIASYLNASIINEGNIKTNRIKSVVFCTQKTPSSLLLKHFYDNSMVIICKDQIELFIYACLAIMNGIKIGAILLIDGFKLSHKILKICKYAIKIGLPIFKLDANIFQTYLNLKSFNFAIPINDHERILKIKTYTSNYINTNWINSIISLPTKNFCYISPQLFKYRLIEMARKANKKIILPEGNEPRTLQAAVTCTKKGIARCILLGNPIEIKQTAEIQNIKFTNDIEIIDPKKIRKNYVSRLLELRKNKGMTEEIANNQLQDNVVLGTLMLEKNEVDGLVSGAIHTTANTIRPPLQIIKTTYKNSLVSSIFFMLLPKQVYIYGDCAINLNPNAEQLAEIAIQSYHSAISFGIDPKLAMLSYSTGNSGAGDDVEKVRKATYLVQKKHPNIIIDGPLQYDAAVDANVASIKTPNSNVAGKATVFIFPDLNSGNITYKAVQKSCNLISIGPILQGMRKPVNDLSRGAQIDDIIYTIAITAIQAEQQKK